MLPVALAWSSSDDSIMYLGDGIMFSRNEPEAKMLRMFRRVCQVVAQVVHQVLVSGSVSQVAAPE